ncbi:MAG TPA: glycosyltransferase family 4 protein [Luteolibacter sp.]
MSFVVACPQRSSADCHAAVLSNHGLLRRYFVGTRKPTAGIQPELTTLNPAWGAAATLSGYLLPGYKGEWVRSALHPLFDAWVTPQIKEGDNLISSYGYANRAFHKVREFGGKTFVDAGNSHPAHFWEVVSEEHKRWGVGRPPYPPHWNRQAREMMELTDYVICPSEYVANSFLKNGFTREQLLYAPFPTDLDLFRPEGDPPSPSPLKVVCTGGVSLRKGFPYLLEAMRIIRKDRDAILLLTSQVEEVMKPILASYSDIPIEWAPTLGHRELAARLRTAHVFALLSLEDGFARTVSEALACGIPAVVTNHTGAMDFIVEGKNGHVVPIRDAQAAAEAIVRASTLRAAGAGDVTQLPDLSFAGFEKCFMAELKRIGLLPQQP